jgi:hypothetical protein
LNTMLKHWKSARFCLPSPGLKQRLPIMHSTNPEVRAAVAGING